MSDALCIPPPRLRDLRPLRPSGGTLAPTPSGDYRPSLRSPWPAAVAIRSIPVLIEGEAGSGKESLACTIHQASSHHHRQPITVNCGAVPPI
ncbi:MAG: sigma 54-interacting transcriptional regulator [Chromatiaceae bacterium]|nr:sigma 54-interacting transcriptional regulator [Chromatiaceae bacterium]MBP8282493.1 sigma 54-interacting transcriptional regulator [Chromatiaceae bacterium]